MVKLSKDEEQQLEFELDQRLYFLYLEWPSNPVPAYHWRTRDGKILAMESMDLSHLKASSTLAKKALDGFMHDRKSGGVGVSAVVEALRPNAQRKIAELREVLLRRAIS